MKVRQVQEIQPGVYQIGDDISIIAVTSRLFLVGANQAFGVSFREALEGHLKRLWPDPDAVFLIFPTEGRADFKPITESPELRAAISEMVTGLFKEVFGLVKEDGA